MKNRLLASVSALLITGASAAILSGSVPARLPGPPMICQPFDIGSAKSIGAARGNMDGYDDKKVVSETLAVLDAQAPTIVRMETLRRATAVVHDSVPLSRELALRLAARALDAEAAGKPSAQAWFDAGYFVASIGQMGTKLGFDPGRESGCDGYAWLKKAESLNGSDPGIQFACALTVHPSMHKGTQELFDTHLGRAASLAANDPLVKKNLDEHCANWKIKVEDLKKKVAAKK